MTSIIELLKEAWYKQWGPYFNSTSFEDQKIEDLYKLPEYGALMRAMAKLKRRKQTVDLHGSLSWCYAGKCGVPGCNRAKYCADCGVAIALEHFPYCQPCLIRRSLK